MATFFSPYFSRNSFFRRAVDADVLLFLTIFPCVTFCVKRVFLYILAAAVKCIMGAINQKVYLRKQKRGGGTNEKALLLS